MSKKRETIQEKINTTDIKPVIYSIIGPNENLKPLLTSRRYSPDMLEANRGTLELLF